MAKRNRLKEEKGKLTLFLGLIQEIWDQWLGKVMEKKPAVLRRALVIGV